MIKNKYETASQTYVRIRNTLLPNNEGAEWLADSKAWEIVDELFINKDELRDKINNVKNIYKDVEGRKIIGERYMHYETITYAKLHQLLDELLEK